ncbi:response regulator receiver domain-containing protein [Palleronia aestuarii]|uniref:Response regulator receiver domain-containing protein n=1 Tax=Palleronia aestuarii TaxID=568105 RepID=A0A2W7MVN5_9RHOB|nr:response regulator [Palleronia aestuarii]PZX11890.1 response regulator receiver domain-containing protein [Palleronia aestuarii]
MLDGRASAPDVGRAERECRVLVVDDDPFALFAIETQIQNLGYTTVTAQGGQEALERLDAADIGLVVLDRVMPDLDGLDVVRQMKRRTALKNVPVVMVTGTDDPDEMRNGIEAGVFYYLQKPVDVRILASVLSAALRRAREFDALNHGGSDTLGFELTQAAKFRVRNLSEAESLSGFLANYFAVPERALPGIGALLVNAVEHGLCGIGFDRKGELLRDGIWRSEVDRIVSSLPADRGIDVTFVRRAEGDVLSVSDGGKGFDWRDRLRLDGTRSVGSHGRGLVQARTLSFDKLSFNEVGNQAVGLINNRTDLKW